MPAGQDLPKALHALVAGPPVGQSRIRVVGNQVHLGRNALEQPRQPVGVLVRVGLAGQQQVLEGDAPA